MTNPIGRRTLAALAATLVAAPVRAQMLPSPKEKAVLTVSGKIGRKNDGDVAKFDRPMLEALGTATLVTKTPWFDGEQHFEGVPLRRVLSDVQASGDHIVAIALNDYTTEIPVSDTRQFDVLLAMKRNGVYMPVRDKGPLFIIYPFDSDSALQTQTYYGRSAWQVSKLIIR